MAPSHPWQGLGWEVGNHLHRHRLTCCTDPAPQCSLLVEVQGKNRDWKERSAGDKWAHYIRIDHFPIKTMTSKKAQFLAFLVGCSNSNTSKKTIAVSNPNSIDSRGSLGKKFLE